MAQTGSAAEPTQIPVILTAPAPVVALGTRAADAAAPLPDTARTRPEAAQVECVAKVILHEAANQPRNGQVAVAQVIRTRMKVGRFGTDACAVVRQRGQFFDVGAYNPSRSSATWTAAVAIAAATLAGEGEELVPGALFFHGVASPMNRVRVAQIADHVFYR